MELGRQRGGDTRFPGAGATGTASTCDRPCVGCVWRAYRWACTTAATTAVSPGAVHQRRTDEVMGVQPQKLVQSDHVRVAAAPHDVAVKQKHAVGEPPFRLRDEVGHKRVHFLVHTAVAGENVHAVHVVEHRHPRKIRVKQEKI